MHSTLSLIETCGAFTRYKLLRMGSKYFLVLFVYYSDKDEIYYIDENQILVRK